MTFPRAPMPAVIILDAPPPVPEAIEPPAPPPVTKTQRRTTRRTIARTVLALLLLAPIVGYAPRLHRSTRAPAPARSSAPSPKRELAPPPSPPAAPSTTIPDDEGLLRTDHSRPGHRIFVDQHIVGTTPQSVLVKCGPATIKLGSMGQPHAVVIPCGRETRFP